MELGDLKCPGFPLPGLTGARGSHLLDSSQGWESVTHCRVVKGEGREEEGCAERPQGTWRRPLGPPTTTTIFLLKEKKI